MPENLFDDSVTFGLPNVAKITIYSPFRYPGGKSRWYFYVKQWVLSTQPNTFIEPFAGGAHAGLTVAIEEWGKDIVDEVILVERDGNVAAVWETIFDGDVEWLLNRILNFEMSQEAAEEAMDLQDRSTRDKAFAMIVHNRVSRGGITAPGAGWLKKGENGKGLNSRWYPDTLVDRIEAIAEVRNRVRFVKGDAFDVWPEYTEDPSVASFVDPPYPKAGGRLYKHSDVDHERIFDISSNVEGSVLLTYDDSEEVKEYVEKYSLESEELVVSTTHHREKKELLIGNDLGWLAGMSQTFS